MTYDLAVSYDDGINFEPFTEEQTTTALITNITVDGVDLHTDIQEHAELTALKDNLDEAAENALLDLYVTAINERIITWGQIDVLPMFQGPYNNPEDFAEELATELGDLDNVPDYILSSIDWAGVWDANLRHEYYEIYLGIEGYYFIHTVELN